MSVLNIVKGSPLFYEILDEEVLKIVEKCRVLNLEPGDYIFKAGDEGNELFILLTGSANVMKNDVVLAKLRKGDLFGEMVLLNENIRHADVVSDNYSDVLVLKYKDIFGLYESDNKMFSLLILNLARLLTNRLRKAGEEIKELKMRQNRIDQKHKKAS